MAKGKLQKKLMCKTLGPMILGMICTVFISYIPFYFQYPSWIDSITDKMLNDQQKTLLQLTNNLASSTGWSLQYPVNFVLLMKTLIEEYYGGTLKVKSDFNSANNYVNARSFAFGEVEGFDNKSIYYDYSMWYLGPHLLETSELNSAQLLELNTSGVFDSFLKPIALLKANYSGILDVSYIAWDQEGLFYMQPLGWETYYVDFEQKNCSYINETESYYDPRCRFWYKALKNSTNQNLAVINKPYVFASGALGQTVCAGYYPNKELEIAGCIDYLLENIKKILEVVNIPGSKYAFAVTTDAVPFIHPKLNTNASELPSIQELEFGADNLDSSECGKFNDTIFIDLQGDRALTSTYDVQQKKYLIAISPINLTMGMDGTIERIGSIGIRLAEEYMTANFNDLKDSLKNIIYIEGIVLIFVLTGILIMCWLLTRWVTEQIVRPMDDLLEILDRMMNGDLDVDIEDHYQVCSQELTSLYSVFGKLKVVLRFREKVYFSEESRAVMNYAQALALFNEFRNIKGAGICYNNLGTIHFKNKRYYQAAECFAKALECAEMLNQSNELIIKRKHLLAKALLHTKNNDRRAVNLLLDIADSYKTDTDDYSKLVSCLLEVAEVLIKNWGEGRHQLIEAEGILDREGTFSTPKNILYERLLYCKGLLLVKQKKLKDACKTFTEALEINADYDPDVRKSCLEELLKIFKEHNQPTFQIEELLEDFEDPPKDIVFVLDYSLSMNGSRIQKALNSIINVIDEHVRPIDKIGFIIFNKQCEVVFNLTHRGNDPSHLKSQIMRWDSPKGGTAFYDAIMLALEEFQAYRTQSLSILPFEDVCKKVSKRLQWIVALTDGEDNASKTPYLKLKKKLRKSKANLVTIGLNLSRTVMPIIANLCEATAKGIFIESASLADLDLAFKTLISLVACNMQTIESLD
ncbi:unnamed protein product [Blepharisma stoltei]|uniref:VWFA domain-containing protein n=1 Tax=Blepharisma stoltei TaxID=1481888 RepID=A0AAU9K9P1_9CILI|nr:unnamed protein product [Blepharisma stoltei]